MREAWRWRCLRSGSRSPHAQRTYGLLSCRNSGGAGQPVVLIGISGLILYEAYARLRTAAFRCQPVCWPSRRWDWWSTSWAQRSARWVARDNELAWGPARASVRRIELVGVAVAGIMWVTGWYYADQLIVPVGIGLFIAHLDAPAWLVGILLEGTLRMSIWRRAADGTRTFPRRVAAVHDPTVWALTSGVYASRPARRAQGTTQAHDEGLSRDHASTHARLQDQPLDRRPG